MREASHRSELFAHRQLIIVIHLEHGDGRSPLGGDADDAHAVPPEMFLPVIEAGMEEAD